MDESALETAFEEIKSTLAFLSDGGAMGFDCSKKSLASIGRWGTGKRVPETLGSIASRIRACRRCALKESAAGTLTGEGNEDADLLFVSEGPGLEKESRGGAAGLFTRMIEAMNLSRDEVFISTIVKCDMAGEKELLPEHLGCCVFFLKQQIQVIRPRFIVSLGPAASGVLLGDRRPFSMVRGHFHDFMGARLMPTFHPSFLLENTEKKRDAWQDLKKLIKAMGLTPPSR